ncbi:MULTISPECIES: hypothetical protein [unclassified Shimia]|uniref:hypothetical protein n=1 Tax=unclassified Shimia TaxID=2630038 RepID=UPI003342D84D
MAIQESSITSTQSRDDGASTQSQVNIQPLVVAAMSGQVPQNRGTAKSQLLALCKAALPEVKAQFSARKYNRIILVSDWRASDGGTFEGFSNAKCKGFSFFSNVRH